MSKELLIEYSLFKPIHSITEGVKKSNAGNMVVMGQIQAADKPNQNKRIYPYEILYKQCQRYLDGPVKEKRALGELDHPVGSAEISLKNVSHNILNLWWEGKNLFGEIEVLPTPSGNIARQLFESNISVGISSRAMGTVINIGEGLVQVEDDLDIICWDFVSSPSTFSAFVKPVGTTIKESISYTSEDKYQRINETISDIICNLSGICCVNY